MDLSRDTALNGAESKDPEDAYLAYAVRSFSITRSRQRSDRPRSFPGREQELLASCHVRQLHLHSRQPIGARLTLASPATCICASCNIRRARGKVSLRPMAASACSTLRVMKTFAKPSLGKNNSKAGDAKRSLTSFAPSMPSSKDLAQTWGWKMITAHEKMYP
jgi:hypothetical protein